jgi:hypothetical protein
MPLSFLKPPVERLTAEGRLERVADGAAWRRPVALIARERCSFEWFEPTQSAISSRAALLYARANAPFIEAGLLVRRFGDGYAIWWWDRAQIDGWLAAAPDAPTPVPETLAQPPGSGWRIVRLTNGVELQYWRGQVLVASSWRRSPPDSADWAAFVRQVRGPTAPAPDQPPAPETLPIRADFPALAGGFELSPQSAPRLAAGVAAAVLAVTAAFWAGQALRLGALAGGIEHQLAAAHAAAAPTYDASAERRSAAYRALAARPDPLRGLAVAMAVLKSHGVAVTSFGVDGPVVAVTTAYAELGKIDQICADLAATGAFAEVRPLPDSAAGVIRIELRLRGAVLVQPDEVAGGVGGDQMHDGAPRP